ncbi:cell division protein FtsQ/DivIB [Microbacterium sp.]|uniref:cell division protein FtsQ/DivIB n=1 Tax=Microbacterium sp. TaxID=51671 RepID=UPI003A893748
MRRPDPLPPPAGQPRSPDAPAADDAARRVVPPWQRHSDPPADAGDAEPVTGSTPAEAAAAAGARPRAASMPPVPTTPDAESARQQAVAPVMPIAQDVPQATGRAAGPAAVPVGAGVREVWAAARARRRALRAEVKRFTAGQRRRRRIWVGAGIAVVALVLGTIAAVYSPLFAVERVRVLGADSLDAAEVEGALEDQLGVPLPLVDTSAVKAALVGFPLVESYALESRPPHELIVRIVERTPIGVLESTAGFTLVDAAGVALATTATAPEGYPVLSVAGGVGSPAFEAVGRVFRALPEEIRTRVSAMAATTGSDVTLTLDGGATDVIWGTADESATKALVLEKTMEALPPEDVSVYDVSSPRAVVVR